MPKATLETVAEWESRNPLRVWRRSTNTTQREVALATGVSTTALQKWENGTSTPNEANMRTLQQMMDVHDLASIWRVWAEQYPPKFYSHYA